MAKSRSQLSSFDLAGIAVGTIEKGTAQEKQLEDIQVKKAGEKKKAVKPVDTQPEKQEKKETRLVSKKPTGVYLYEDQVETIRKLEYKKKKRNISSETVRRALDEYFANHNIV